MVSRKSTRSYAQNKGGEFVVVAKIVVSNANSFEILLTFNAKSAILASQKA